MDNTESWDGFLGSNFLKAEDVKDIETIYIVKKVEMDVENNRPLLVLESAGITTKFGLNVTNSQFVKNEGINSPRDLIGKQIKFKIVQAFSPNAKKEVDSLRIVEVK